MNNLLLVCLLGGVGATARYLLARWNGTLPWGILLGNTLAATIATLALNGEVSVVLIAGFAGGLSTFSTLIAQTSGLWTQSKAKAVANLALNLVIPSTVALGFGLLAATLLK